MKKKVILAVIIMGFSGLVAQIILLRELMIAFHGNELSIGIVLANWLLLEAAGAFFLGRKISQAKKKLAWFIFVTILFSLLFITAVYLTRVFKEFLPVMPGEGLGIIPMFYVSFIILFPVSLLHGALFTSGCKLYFVFSSPEKTLASEDKLSAFSIARVYIFETLGTIAGGIILTYLLIPYLHSFEIALIITLLNIGICAFLLEPFWKPRTPAITKTGSFLSISLLLFILYLLFSASANQLHLFSVQQQWKHQNLVHYKNSNYGNIVVVERENEYTFFSDGMPVITSPNPDIVYIEEFVHFTMLSHPAPENVLILSGGAGGVINEILKYDVKRIDYAEVDPLMPAIIKEFSTLLTERELKDKRVNIKEVDGRFFLKRTPNKYDVIFSGFTDPSTLQTNRFFTKEFYTLANNKLACNGILVIGIPGSLTYISPELADMNAMVYNTLQTIYPYVRIIPGDGINFYLASRSPEVEEIGHAEMIERLSAHELQLKLVTPGYLEYRMHPRWLEWFYDQMKGSTEIINSDFRPLGVFYSLVYWNEKFSPTFNHFFKRIENLNIYFVALIISVLSVLFLTISSRTRNPLKPALTLCIFSTGFAGMLFDLILIFAFQVLYGYIFYWLGLLVTAFMAGVMVGGMWMAAHIKKADTGMPALIKLEIVIISFALLLPFVFINAGNLLVYTWFDYTLRIVFLILSFISGILVGAEFPLANNEYMKISADLGGTAGLLYSADLMGGWLGGIIGAVILLPVLGLVETTFIVILFKISSLFTLIILSKR